jgi:hypothetical protein
MATCLVGVDALGNVDDIGITVVLVIDDDDATVSTNAFVDVEGTVVVTRAVTVVVVVVREVEEEEADEVLTGGIGIGRGGGLSNKVGLSHDTCKVTLLYQ